MSDFKFKPEDFLGLQLEDDFGKHYFPNDGTCEELADRVNCKLKEKLKKAPTVYRLSNRMWPEVDTGWFEKPTTNCPDTHKAKLVCIEEING